jgi:hypothetical protein
MVSMIDVTRVVLEEVAKWTALQGDQLDRQPQSIAFVSYRRGAPMVRYQPAGR